LTKEKIAIQNMNTVIYQNGIRYCEKQYKLESDFERVVVENSKTFFGENTIYVDAKKKIDNDTFGGVIPDGFLIDFSDKNNPEFYLVEVELVKHSFFNHIFPQITKFFAFFKNPNSQGKLIEKLYSIFENDALLRQELKSKIGAKEIFKFIKDTIENSQNILLIIDGEKRELPEIIETYTDTWGKLVKVAILKEYCQNSNQTNSIFTLTPDFENIENIDIVFEKQDEEKEKSVYSESFHLEDVDENVKAIYLKIKGILAEKIPTLQFNSQRYYISLRKKRNFAFLKIRKKKIGIVAMMKEQEIREKITNHQITTLSEGVQKFYNGPCAKIEIVNDENLGEIINLLMEIQK
jgi:predicted transport protein